MMIWRLFCSFLFASLSFGAPAQSDPRRESAEFSVEARNFTQPELCAEKDNVQIDFVSPLLRSFQLKAVHPAYIGTITTDRWAPDLTSCDIHPNASSFAEEGERITLWESPMLQLVGYRIKEFWRPANTIVRVGDKKVEGLQVAQLLFSYRERSEEALVFYPPDGYWRIRPFPFGDMRWTAYGSSFLIGPVEMQGRPIVDIREIAFDPTAKTFTLTFRRGGAARMKVSLVDQDQFAIDVTFDGPRPPDLPFASLRSMYANETNADAARAAWRVAGGRGWTESDLFGFEKIAITELWVGRRLPSRHNMSAPDMIFGRFAP